MGGGLMQLVAYGAQDIYLTGNPQITFFKVVYRRHTNFAMESIEQTFNGTANFGNRVTCTISRNGDLVHRMWLQTTLPKLDGANDGTNGYGYGYCDEVGHALVENVELEIGGQRVDKHYSEWLSLWQQLSQRTEHSSGYDTMIGNVATTAPRGVTTGLANSGENTAATTIYVPLQFWFCRNPGLALPLIALQYHEVKVNLQFRALSGLILEQLSTAGGAVAGYALAGNHSGSTAPTGELSGTSLWVDYVYLDTDERRRFAQVSHEYLIEQLQFTGDESAATANPKLRLNFNHPVKELVWVVREDAMVGTGVLQHFNWSSAAGTQDGTGDRNVYDAPASARKVSDAKLQLNGHDRFATRNGDYFNLVQPYQHHTRVPASVGVNVYSFALKPEEHQPSGTCNFSRIDNATLNLTLDEATASTVKVFAVNYNVLRVMSGMGGLAYSN